MSNERRVDAAVDKVKGKVKEAAGKLTGDKRTETEGEVDQVKGDAKHKVEDVKDVAKGTKDALRDDDDRAQ